MTRTAPPVMGSPETRTEPEMFTGEVTVRPTGPFAFVRQLVSFGAVGGMAFVVDLGVYNLLRATLLDDKPIAAKIVSVAVATAVAWLGNRFLTFRGERSTDRRETVREGLLFAAMNLIGLGISAACLFVSHYVLGFTSTLADNVAGNGIGLVLGTAFRFAAYKALVFRPVQRPSAQHPVQRTSAQHPVQRTSAQHRTTAETHPAQTGGTKEASAE